MPETTRFPLWHDFGPFTYDAMPGKDLNSYLAKQNATTLRAVADLMEKCAGGGPLWNVAELAAELRAVAEAQE